MTFQTRLWAAGFLFILIPLAAVTCVAFRHNESMTSEAAAFSQALEERDLDEILRTLRSRCAAQQEKLDQKALDGLRVAREFIARQEGLSLDSGAIVPLADEIGRLVWQRCTIFRRQNDAGDFVPVSTNVATPTGARDLAKRLRPVGSDGTPNPIVAALMKGETYVGLSREDGTCFTTAYEPIHDRRNRIIGAFSIAVRRNGADDLEQTIDRLLAGRSIDLTVLDSKGSLLLSRDGDSDGVHLWDAHNERGGLVLDEICRKAALLGGDEIGSHQYRWKIPGENGARCRVARIISFAPWDWVIGTGCDRNDLYTRRDRTIEAGMTARGTIGALAGFLVLFFSLVWFVLVRSTQSLRRRPRGLVVKTVPVESNRGREEI